MKPFFALIDATRHLEFYPDTMRLALVDEASGTSAFPALQEIPVAAPLAADRVSIDARVKALRAGLAFRPALVPHPPLDAFAGFDDAGQLARTHDAAIAAVADEKSGGPPAELTLAQWALESGYGLHAPGHNPFGIKARNGEPFQTLLTNEVINGIQERVHQNFVVFPSLAAAFARHSNLITAGAPYAQAWAQYQRDRNVDNLVRGISVHYATAPNYADLLLGYVHAPRMIAVLQAARG